MFFRKKRVFRNLTLAEIKEKTRILFIDDQDVSGIIDYLAKSNWNCLTLLEKDFDTIDLPCIKDSHIICVDINSVGERLGKNNGLDIVKSIKSHFQGKKIIIYSSQSTQNIFHDAIDLADKKILKSAGDFEVFRDSIEELAKQIFSWDKMLEASYEQVKDSFREDISFDEYKKNLEKISISKKFSVDKIASVLEVTADVAKIIYMWVGVFL